MSAERFFEHFEQVVEAPGAVSHLRRFILDLAGRGKLVPGSSDWASVTLGELGTWGSGGTPLRTHPEYYGGDIPWVVIGDLNDSVVTRTENYITEAGLENSSARIVEPGTIFVAMYGSIGKLGIAGMRCATNQAIAYCVPNEHKVTREFLVLLLKGMRDDLLAKGQGVAQQNISQKILKAHAVRLPPIAEQRRIVAKVDELIELCDQMHAARREREKTRDLLADASFARLNAPDPDPDVFRSGARSALLSLKSITARPDQIRHLRQVIVNLAVRGKLVSQDPSDEPASDLLKRISDERLKSTGRKRLLAAINESEQPFKSPPGWQWVRMGDAFSMRTGFAFKSSTYTKAGTLVFRVTNFDRDGRIDLSDSVYFPTENIDARLSKYLLHPGEIIMVMVGGTIGKTMIVDEKLLPALLNQNMWRIRSFGAKMSNKFEYLLLKSVNRSIQGLTQSTHGHFAMSDYETRIVPVPPLAEQHRIVSKVDEYMTLCNELEASLAAGDATRRHLLGALVSEALTMADGETADGGNPVLLRRHMPGC